MYPLLLTFRLRPHLYAARSPLCQNLSAYINTLLKRFPGFSATIAKHAPLPSRKLEEDDFETPAVLTPYQELVGSLLWLTGCTRPDIAFAASFLARYTASPTEEHWQLALRVLSYLSHTQGLGITLGGGSNLQESSHATLIGPAASKQQGRLPAMSHIFAVLP
ncbi:hypothetical protein LQV05_000926 [Cryptococcus neoformans]|nr:hypothetical protein LQV05_000926 [Cryptococcus neoformans]